MNHLRKDAHTLCPLSSRSVFKEHREGYFSRLLLRLAPLGIFYAFCVSGLSFFPDAGKFDAMETQKEQARKLWENFIDNPKDIASACSISLTTLYAWVKEGAWERKGKGLSDPAGSANILALQSLLACNDVVTLFDEYKQAAVSPLPLASEWLEKQLHQILLKIPLAVALMPPNEWLKNANSLVKLLELVNNFIITNKAPTTYAEKTEEKRVFSATLPPALP